MTEKAPSQWRIQIKSYDEGVIDYKEDFAGSPEEAKARAWLMWARTSYLWGARHHRDVYVRLEYRQPSSGMWTRHWEHRGRLADGAPAPSGS